jgi:hypothetical protein
MNDELTESIKQVILAFPEVVKYLTPETLDAIGVDDEVKTQGYYERALWDTVRGFYNSGNGSAYLDRMIATIRQQLTRAWREGAAAVGFNPDEMDMEDLAELERIIHDESEFIFRLGDDILRAKANGEDVGNFKQRVSMWANRYGDVVNQAKIWFGRKVGTKLKWVLGATEEHCGTCAELNGKVAYAKEWDEAGIHPQQPPNGVLECGGWKCQCSLVPTNERRTWGILNKLLDMAVVGNI